MRSPLLTGAALFAAMLTERFALAGRKGHADAAAGEPPRVHERSPFADRYALAVECGFCLPTKAHVKGTLSAYAAGYATGTMERTAASF